MLHQGQQAQDVPTVAMCQVAHALARAFLAPADADVVQLPQAQAVNGKAAATNRTRDFSERIKGQAFADADTEDADAIDVRRAYQADRS
jgi:hypothetical protein